MGIVVGVDIGTKYIKFAAVEKKKNIDIKWMDCVPTPEGSISNGELINMEAVMYAISDYCSRYKLKRATVAVCMNTSHMGTKNFEMAAVADKMLDKAVQLEFYNQLGLSIEDYSLSYKIFEKNRKEIKGIMVYCPSKYVNDYQELFRRSELNLKYLDMNANSIAKFYKHLVIKEPGEDAVALVDIGTETSHISIVKGKVLCASRSVTNGGNDLDQVISEHLGISVEEAILLKHDKFRKIYEEGKDLEAQMNSAYSGLLRELEYTIGKFQEEYGSDVSRILLLGGGSNLPGLNAYMKQDLKKTTQLLMGSNIRCGFVTDVHFYANAIGAAIRED
jgi:type IV pilus assembly protein PilM